MKKFTLFILPLSLLVSVDAGSRRQMRHLEKPGAIYHIPTKKIDPTIHYDANGRAGTLHRKALKAFYAKQFETSEACFSLAYKNWPHFPELIQNYIICSAIFPEKFNSLNRCRSLLEEEKRLVKKRDSKSWFAESLLVLREDGLEPALKTIAHVKKLTWQKRMVSILTHLNKEPKAFDLQQLIFIMRPGKSPAEKRNPEL